MLNAPLLPFAAVAALALSTSAAAASRPVQGKWLTENGKALVNIAPCGQSLCGKIVKIVKATPGRPHTDFKNPDPALRDKPVVGLNILTGFKDVGSIWKGAIYDPESGKSYKSKLDRNPDGTLKVQGCIAFLCRTQTWTATH